VILPAEHHLEDRKVNRTKTKEVGIVESRPLLF